MMVCLQITWHLAARFFISCFVSNKAGDKKNRAARINWGKAHQPFGHNWPLTVGEGGLVSQVGGWVTAGCQVRSLRGDSRGRHLGRPSGGNLGMAGGVHLGLLLLLLLHLLSSCHVQMAQIGSLQHKGTKRQWHQTSKRMHSGAKLLTVLKWDTNYVRTRGRTDFAVKEFQHTNQNSLVNLNIIP